MNRDLKNEYRQLITNDIPDLWARIEEELEPKKKKRSRVRFKAFAAAAAACVCLAISVPVVMLSIGYGGSNSSNSSGAATNNTNNSASASSDMAAAPTYDTGDGAFNAASTAEDYVNYDEAQMSGGIDTSVSASATEVVSEEAERENGSEDGISIEVYAQILEVIAEDDAIVYLARVEASDSDALEAGIEIKIYSSSTDIELLEEGERCELLLIQWEADGEIPVFYKQNS